MKILAALFLCLSLLVSYANEDYIFDWSGPVPTLTAQVGPYIRQVTGTLTLTADYSVIRVVQQLGAGQTQVNIPASLLAPGMTNTLTLVQTGIDDVTHKVAIRTTSTDFWVPDNGGSDFVADWNSGAILLHAPVADTTQPLYSSVVLSSDWCKWFVMPLAEYCPAAPEENTRCVVPDRWLTPGTNYLTLTEQVFDATAGVTKTRKIVFAFLVNGFVFTTTNPDQSISLLVAHDMARHDWHHEDVTAPFVVRPAKTGNAFYRWEIPATVTQYTGGIQ